MKTALHEDLAVEKIELLNKYSSKSVKLYLRTSLAARGKMV